MCIKLWGLTASLFRSNCKTQGPTRGRIINELDFNLIWFLFETWNLIWFYDMFISPWAQRLLPFWLYFTCILWTVKKDHMPYRTTFGWQKRCQVGTTSNHNLLFSLPVINPITALCTCTARHKMTKSDVIPAVKGLISVTWT